MATPLFLANAISFSSVDVTVTSTAGLIPVDGTEGLRPFAVRDDCLEGGGSGCEDYGYPYVGEPVTMKYGPQDNPEEEYWFGPVDFPPTNKGCPQTGANAYRNNIKNGYDGTVEIGDTLRVEPGNMAGPTQQGVNYVIGLDSSAYWSSCSNKIVNSSYPDGQSPRIIKVVFYDPNVGIVGHPGEITVSRIGAFFLEGVTGPPDRNVTGRFIETVASGQLDKYSISRVFGVGLLE